MKQDYKWQFIFYAYYDEEEFVVSDYEKRLSFNPFQKDKALEAGNKAYAKRVENFCKHQGFLFLPDKTKAYCLEKLKPTPKQYEKEIARLEEEVKKLKKELSIFKADWKDLTPLDGF